MSGRHTPLAKRASFSTTGGISLAALAALLGLALPRFATVALAANEVALCHATGSALTPYVRISIAAAGAYSGHIRDHHQHGRDIVPPFTYRGQTYSRNWDAAGRQLLDNGCLVPSPSPTPPVTPQPTADLRVEKLAVPSTTLSRAGDIVTFTVSVTNLGPNASSLVELQDGMAISGLAEIVRHSSSRPATCGAAPTGPTPVIGLSCMTTGPLPAGDVWSVELVVRFLQTSTYVNRAEAHSSTADPDPSNNVALWPALVP